MISSIRILILEDNLKDCELLEETLRSEKLSSEIVCAKTKEEFESAVKNKNFDLVLSDFTIPGYSGIAALAFFRQIQPDTPFIFVSGTIGEDRAVESLKLGATDYVLKDRLTRLGPVVERALREKEERAERERSLKKSKQLEEQLHQAQKMEAVGRLAGGIAHDFNNLLLVIHGNAELMLHGEEQLNQQSHQSIKRITDAAARAANLVRQLLIFSRKQVVHFQPFNLNQLIGNLMKMIGRIIGEDISLQCQHAENLPPIHADMGMIEQALTNLILNAREAMPVGGTILISTETADIDDAGAENHPDARTGKFVCVTIQDTGEGIAMENLAHVFEPFFTTKETGRGLGLAAVYGIVKQHHGWIKVRSKRGAGSAFKIFLPAKQMAGAETIVPIEKKAPGGNERILLVEDDADVRRFLRDVLESDGYQIVEAENGVEALKIWKERAMQFDLLLTDVVMPGGINGRMLTERLIADRPELKTILMSGYNPEIAGKIRPNGCFLQKPCSMDLLIETVRNCLDKKL